MFRKPPDAPAGVTVFVAGQPVRMAAGESAAAAVLLADLGFSRSHPVDGGARLPYCMMGVCFECLMVIDGAPGRQGCLVPVREGMRIEPMAGLPDLAGAPP